MGRVRALMTALGRQGMAQSDVMSNNQKFFYKESLPRMRVPPRLLAYDPDKPVREVAKAAESDI